MQKTPFLLLAIITTCTILLFGCGKPPVRHLNSDVALLKKGISQQEVIAIMGQPTSKKTVGEKQQWIYVEAHKSLLKRVWLLSMISGTTNYEIVRVTFSDDSLETSSFRYATAEEFLKSGLAPTPETDPDEF